MTVDVTIFAIQIVVFGKLKHKKTVIMTIRSGPGEKTKETLHDTSLLLMLAAKIFIKQT